MFQAIFQIWYFSFFRPNFLVKYQKTMIDKGVLKLLVDLIGTSNISVQSKAFDIILDFDGSLYRYCLCNL